MVWTVFFMRKLFQSVYICVLLLVMVWCGSFLADKKQLAQDLIRFHVVANSDSAQDQQEKLLVRDAVAGSLQETMKQMPDSTQARQYLREHLPELQNMANQTLRMAGSSCNAAVSLCTEAFDTRFYDTFSLPAGIYDALKITIGEGNGHNWWCVAFPTLCLPATSEGFQEVSAQAGISGTLEKTLAGEDGYEIRFFLLDQLGKLENHFFQS